MQLRQRTLTASEAEGSQYNLELVQGTFLRTVKTGLRDESIRAHLAPYLSQATAGTRQDSVLLKEANLAEIELEEKLKKKRVGGREVKVAQASAQEVELGTALKPLLEGMTMLTKQMAEMQSWRRESGNQASRREGSDKPSNPTEEGRRRYIRCPKCVKDGSDRCGHCFKCSSKDHFARDCSSKNSHGSQA
jgi:predicted RNase H-like nuclease